MNAAELRAMRDLESRHFWFRARRNALGPWLARGLAESPPGPALELGVGSGGNLGLLRGLCGERTLLGLDSSALALELASEQGASFDALRADASRQPFLDASLAFVALLDVLEHLDDDCRALAELARCTLPGAMVVISVPAHPGLFSDHDRALGHRRRYAAGDLEARLARAGFEVLESRGFNSLLLPATALWRRLPHPAGIIRSDVRPLAAPLNWALGGILALEERLPAGIGRRWGLSRWVLARRES